MTNAAKLPYPLFDADNHLYETQDSLTQFLPKEYKNAIQYVQFNGRTKIAIRGQISDFIPNPTFEVVARPGAMEDYFKYGNPDGKSRREIFGEPMRAIPAFREPGPRLELMNELGVDRSLMFPTLASLIEERMRDDPALIHVVVHALNQWLHEAWGFNYQNRIFTVPVISLPIVEKAIDELDWVVKRGARVVLIRPAPVPGYGGPRSFALPEFDPFWQRCVEHDVLVAMHTSDSGYARYNGEWNGDGKEMLPMKTDAFGMYAQWRPGSGRGRLLGYPRRPVPLSHPESFGDRKRCTLAVPVAGQPRRRLQEGAGGLRRQPDRGDQEPHPPQPVLRGGRQRADRSGRRRAECCSVRTSPTPRASRSQRISPTRSATFRSASRPRSWAAIFLAWSRCDRLLDPRRRTHAARSGPPRRRTA